MQVRCAHDRLVPIAELKAHPRNRNIHPPDQVARLAEILHYQGWRRPVRISKRSGFTTAGHGATLAAQMNGWTHVPANFQDYESEEQEYADLIADNSIALWAELDEKGIKKDLEELPNVQLEMLGQKIEPLNGPTEGEDEIPEPPKVAKTRRGELWILGNHRLLIDDCTVKENVERLMAGEKADMVFTDPPYGIDLDTDYSGMGETTTTYRKVEGDDRPFDPTCIFAVPADEYWLWGADYYSNRIPNYEDGSYTVWTKAHSDEENKVWTSRFEIVWVWPKRKKEVWFVRSMQHLHGERTGEHPTQKPVELATRAFSVSKSAAINIVDLFLGSGSTLIACEKTNRHCFGMEIEPLYSDVVILRYLRFTGRNDVFRLEPNGNKTPWTEVWQVSNLSDLR